MQFPRQAVRLPKVSKVAVIEKEQSSLASWQTNAACSAASPKAAHWYLGPHMNNSAFRQQNQIALSDVADVIQVTRIP
jgi:hypothetical protein